jgi:hypothetical protein
MSKGRKQLDLEIKDGFGGITTPFVDSPAFRAMRLYESKILMALLGEIGRNGPASNGKIVLSYRNMLKAIGLNHMGGAVEAVANLAALGAIDMVRNGNMILYRITFLPTPAKQATNDWRAIRTDEHAVQALRRADAYTRKAKANAAKRLRDKHQRYPAPLTACIN